MTRTVTFEFERFPLPDMNRVDQPGFLPPRPNLKD